MFGQETLVYHFGPFVLDGPKRRLVRDGEVVRLTPKAFETLLALVEERGKTIEKDELRKRVWGDTVVEDNNLNQSITALRKALGDSRNESQYIATIPGQGYRFVADVREERLGVTGAAPPGTAPPAVAETRPTPASRRWLIVVGIMAVALLLLGLVSWTRRSEPERLKITSVMVLPLENLSGDPSQEYFADGMTDALIGDLARINGLRVISRTSSMHYKGKTKPLPDIASELKVDGVVEGTVQRSGDRVLVRAQLIHAASDTHLWVQTYERDVKDVLTMQSEIAQAIAREVQAKTTSSTPPTAQRPVRPKAFDEYLQGRYLYWNKRTEENLQKAIEHFQNAIKEDPDYALPYVGLADCYYAMGTVQVGSLPPLAARKRGEEAATKALALDNNLAEAHSSLGYVHHFNWNWDAAEQSFKRALELNPNYANAHNLYANLLMAKGSIDESLAASNRARELDPFSLAISVQRGFLLENARRYDEAIEQFRSVIAMDPDHYQAYWMLGHTYAASGRHAEAIAAAEKATALSDRAPGALGILGLVYGLAGRKDDATKILNELLELNKKRYVTPAALVNVYIGLGDKERALSWLEKAYEERSNYVAYMNVFPIVEPLRSDPRFAALLQKVGLHSYSVFQTGKGNL